MKQNLTKVLFLIAVLWGIKVLDTLIPFDFVKLGILPRTVSGLKGILFAPLIHANYLHLIANTIPIGVLLSVLFTFYKKEALSVIVSSIFMGGGLVWLFGRSAYHIGISGLIYSLAAFLIAVGIFKKDIRSLLISVIIMFLYGGLVWGMFPGKFWVSWESHLFGALAGVVMAFILANKKK